MDEKLRMLDSRIQQSVLHSVLDPAGGGQGQNRPLLEQMCLGMEGANVTDMVAEAESILVPAHTHMHILSLSLSLSLSPRSLTHAHTPLLLSLCSV